MVSYSPLYHPASLGACEREHKEIKHGLKAALVEMGQQHQSRWMDALPFVMLGRHTVYQPALGTSAAEVVLGECPTIPGDLVTHSPEGTNIQHLLDQLRAKAAKPTAPTVVPPQPVYFPATAETCTHVMVEVAKKTPLGPTYRGPFEIIERLGDSCLKVKVGDYVSGKPRFEVVHWNNCQPAPVDENTIMDQRPTLGRPPNRQVNSEES